MPLPLQGTPVPVFLHAGTLATHDHFICPRRGQKCPGINAAPPPAAAHTALNPCLMELVNKYPNSLPVGYDDSEVCAFCTVSQEFPRGSSSIFPQG